MYHSSAQMMIPRTTPCVKVLIIVNLVCWFLLVSIVQRFFMKNRFYISSVWLCAFGC